MKTERTASLEENKVQYLFTEGEQSLIIIITIIKFKINLRI